MAAIQAGVQEARNAEATDDEENGKKTPPANKYIVEALSLAAGLEHPNPMTIISLTTVLGGRNMGNAQEVQISEADRQKLSQLLVKWYPEMSRSPQYGSWAYFAATQSLAQNSDPTAYVQFLDDEVNRYQNSGRGATARNQMQMIQYMGRPQQSELLKPLAFPPSQLADFPQHVLLTFSTNQNMNPYGSRQHLCRTAKSTRRKSSPCWKALRARFCEYCLPTRRS